MTVSEELETIRTGAAIFSLTDRAFLRITGPDATRWLNGMVTNSIQSLEPGEGNYNFLLNAQGRIMGDCTIYKDSTAVQDNYLLETSTDQIETIHQLLDKFIIMDDVELVREYTKLQGVLIFGNAVYVVKLMADLGITKFREADFSHTNLDHGFLFLKRMLGEKAAQYQFELWAESIQPWMDKLQALGVPHSSPTQYEAHRILSGIPLYGTDIRNSDTARDLPQETAQTHALHFAKGCYLGQEIVERIRSRGQVHRTFTRFILTGDMPTLPAKLTSDDKPAGDITSAILIGDTIHALGYIRRELLETQAQLTYPGGIATASK